MEETDVILQPDNKSGIKKQSLLRTSKIATLDKTPVKNRLGSLNTITLKEVYANLKEYLRIT